MTNFIFKSPATYKKLASQLDVILSEQRHQRSDLQYIKNILVYLKNDKNLQKTVDEWYAKSPDPDTCVAPPNEDRDED